MKHPSRNSRRKVLAIFLVLAAMGFADEKKNDFSIPESTLSPDHRYGITVPILDFDRLKQNGENALVEIATGKTLAIIDAEVAFSRMPHGGVLSTRWSPKGNLLIWEADSKWGPDALVLLELQKDNVAQFNLLKLAQQTLLKLTREAEPEKYAAAKKANAGNGSWYPEGFTIDVQALDPVALPIHLRAELTSNPKALDDYPNLNSWLEATVDRGGKFTVSKFRLGPGESPHFTPHP